MKWELMTEREIHEFGIQTIIPYLEKEGVTVEKVNPNPELNPQIIGQRWGKPTIIAVRTACYPNKGQLTMNEHMQLMHWADKHGAIPFFASVGIACASYPDKTPAIENDMSLPIRNGGFYIAYEGLVVVTTSDRVRTIDELP